MIDCGCRCKYGVQLRTARVDDRRRASIMVAVRVIVRIGIEVGVRVRVRFRVRFRVRRSLRV